MFEWLFGKTFVPERDIPDLSGKVILVTGGNTGLGKETIRQLALHSPSHIFLAARTESKARDAISSIKSHIPDANITFLSLDLSSFDSISACAKTFTSLSPRLDILLNNAGIMAVPYSTTAQGHEMQLGTNHLGHALLTKLLLPTLLRTAEESGADVRVVNLSSDGHMMSVFSGGVIYDVETAKAYNTWLRYGSSKLANVLYARALGMRYPQLTVVALHPGVVDTNLFSAFKTVVCRGWRPAEWVVDQLARVGLSTVETGARNSLWCCTAVRTLVREGYYYTPVGKRGAGIWYNKDQRRVDELWEWTERELERAGY